VHDSMEAIPNEEGPPQQLSRDVFKQENHYREWREQVALQHRLMETKKETEFWKQKYLELREFAVQHGHNPGSDDRKVRRTNRNASPRGSPRDSPSTSRENSPRQEFSGSPSPSPRTLLAAYPSRNSPRSKPVPSSPNSQAYQATPAKKKERTRSASVGPEPSQIRSPDGPPTQTKHKRRHNLTLQLTNVNRQHIQESPSTPTYEHSEFLEPADCGHPQIVTSEVFY